MENTVGKAIETEVEAEEDEAEEKLTFVDRITGKKIEKYEELLNVKVNYYNEDPIRRIAYINVTNIDDVSGMVVAGLYCPGEDFWVNKTKVLEPGEDFLFGFSYGNIGCEPKLYYDVERIEKVRKV